MGFNIYYEGTIGIAKEVGINTCNIINGLAETRRIRWDADKLEADGIAQKEQIGKWGEFFFGHKDLKIEQLIEFEKKYASKILSPPPGQPSYYSQWIIGKDRMSLEWNRIEKSYDGHEWLQYIVKKILVPRGYYPSGIINWFIERCMYDNEWHTLVEGNSVRKYRGYSNKEKEPDIDTWYEEQSELFEKYNQEWLKKLIDKKIEFLHERIASSEDNTT